MNPPVRGDFQFQGPYLHWDVDLTKPLPKLMQGVLYLTDTLAHQGAFTCIPGFHHRLAEWLQSLPKNAEPREAIRRERSQDAVSVAGRAGDLIVWHSGLPHGSSPNTSHNPRIVQYITMSPSREDDDQLRRERIEGWRERRVGLGHNQPDGEQQPS